MNTTTQGTITPAGVVNYDPNTGKKLTPGQSVQVAEGGNTYGSTLPIGGTQVQVNPVTSSSPVAIPTTEKTAGQIYDFGTEDPALSAAISARNNATYDIANTPIDESAIRAKKLAEIQAEIDAQNTIYADKLRTAKVQGAGRLGTATAIQGRRGLLGSDFGESQTQTVVNENTGIESSIQNELAAKIAALQSGARSNADAEIAAKRAAKEAGLNDYITYLQSDKTRKEANTTKVVNALVAQGVDPTKMDKSALDSIASGYGVKSGDIVTAYNLQSYTANKAKTDEEAKRKADVADALAKKGIENISEGTSGYRFNPATGQYELVASVKKTYAPKESTGTGTGSTGGAFDITTLSPQAQSYINAIQRGDYASLQDALKGIGTTKAALALKNEIIIGYNAIAGGKEGTKLITQPEAANFEKLLTNIKKIDTSAYGQFDTPGGLLSGVAKPTTSAYIDNLLGNLTLEKRSLLKGSGAISDKENAMLADSVSILSRKNISEEAAAAALKDIENILSEKVNNYYKQTSQSRPGATQTNPQAQSLRTKYNY